MKRKTTYVKPSVEVIAIEHLEPMMAGTNAIPLNQNNGGVQGSKRTSMYDEDPEYTSDSWLSSQIDLWAD